MTQRDRGRTTTRTAPGRQPFLPKDLLRQVLITGLTVSPDGQTVVYARRTIEKGQKRSRLWRVPMAGGRPERLTTADANDTEPRFAPDGRSILFVSDRGKKSQPWVLPAGGGEATMLAELPEGATTAEWAPDGRAVLCLSGSGVQRFAVGDPKDLTARRVGELTWRYDERGIRDQHTAAWVVNSSGRGKPERVTDPGYDVTHAFWSPDGGRVGFLADRSPHAAIFEVPGVWSVTRAGRAPRPLADFDGSALAAAWGRGGVVFTGWEARVPAWRNVGLYVADPGVRRIAAELDLTFWPFTWSELIPLPAVQTPVFLDDERFIVLGHVRGRCVPFLVGRDDTPEPLVQGDTDVGSVATCGGRIAVVAAVAGNAAEVHELTDRGLRRITKDGSRWFGPFQRAPEEISVRHHGVDVQGWLTRARGRRNEPRPLVLEIHGGPYDAAGPTRLCEELALADAGYHVLAMNPRGSIGFGEDYARALHGRWGVPDAEDLLATVGWAVRRGLADRTRVGLLGLSYGGFMVHHLLGAYPGRFRAAVSENPFVSSITDLGACDTGAVMEEETGVGSWPEDLDGWLAISPVMRIHRNRAPLLLLQADEDHRCPPAGTEIAFTILRRLGRTVEMVRYPEESHSMLITGRPDRRVDRLERIVDWFERYL